MGALRERVAALERTLVQTNVPTVASEGGGKYSRFPGSKQPDLDHLDVKEAASADLLILLGWSLAIAAGGRKPRPSSTPSRQT